MDPKDPKVPSAPIESVPDQVGTGFGAFTPPQDEPSEQAEEVIDEVISDGN